jgi:hypothetical protein
MSKPKLKKELETENANLRDAIGKQAIWINSINEHYAEVQRQLLAINSSMLVVQKNLLHFLQDVEAACQ